MPNTSAESKARQRSRNAGGPRSGTSGLGLLVSHMERKEFEDIEQVAVDGPGFAAQITDVMAMANRDLKVSMIVPAAYAFEVIALHQDSMSTFTWFRSSHVPRRAMLPERDDEDGDGDED